MSNGLTDAPSSRIYRVVLSVGVVCSLAIASVYEITRPIIGRNRIAFRQHAILAVLPSAATVAAYQLDETSGVFQATSTGAEGSDLVFAGFGDDGELVGLAIETHGVGYQDVIRLVYGYSPRERAIIGIRVLESRETPGLGDRIASDANFLRNFARLDVTLDPEGKRLAHAIEFVKSGQKTEPWQIDGITGATISSRATAEMVGDSAAVWIPLTESRISDFETNDRKEQ